MIHEGSCHCRRIRFRVEGDIQGVISCNCTICQRNVIQKSFEARENLQLLTTDADASTYAFNKHVIQHRFCPVCGIHPFGEGTDRTGKAMAAINIRCLENIDLDKIPVTPFDGRAL
jgi:hypothetical protein